MGRNMGSGLAAGRSSNLPICCRGDWVVGSQRNPSRQAARIARVPRAERIARARGLIAQVGLSGFENHYPGELSGGMRKRVSLARAFGAQTLLMDEPFGALDAQLKLLIEAELMRLWQTVRQTIL